MNQPLSPSKLAGLIVVLLILPLAGACGVGSTPTPFPTPTPVPTATPVPFENMSFKVPAGSEYQVSFNLPARATVEYKFRSNLDIDVRFEDPQGNRVAGSARAYSGSGSVAVNSLGTYALVFDNTFFLLTGKDVNLAVRVVPPGGR